MQKVHVINSLHTVSYTNLHNSYTNLHNSYTNPHNSYSHLLAVYTTPRGGYSVRVIGYSPISTHIHTGIKKPSNLAVRAV